jgi:CRP/FNR family cyclic AMP-dependent transcriptional regulator
MDSTSLFAHMDETALLRLSPNGHIKKYSKDTLIIRQHESSQDFYILMEGEVKVFITDEEAREITLRVLGDGDYFGEIILDGKPRSASVLCTKITRTFVVPLEDLEKLVEGHAVFAWDLIRRLSRKVRDLSHKIIDLAYKDNYARFSQFIQQHMVEQDGVYVIPGRLSQQEVANRIGGSREMVNRILNDLVEGGYLSIKAQRITVHKKLPLRW